MMIKKPKISVIMGVYNGEKTLNRAIESICAQTFTDWELIICDDCSDDGTKILLQKWCKREPRIISLRNEKNCRLATSLNRCLEKASGEYIARMDDDDVSFPERFEIQSLFLDTHPEYGFVSSMVDGFDGQRIFPDYWHRKEKPEKRDFLLGSQFVHPATMFRKDALQKVGGYRVCKETRRMEDYDLFMRLYSVGYRGYNIQKTLLKYYVNPGKTLYRHRIDEVRVRYNGFKQLGLFPQGLIYVIRPLIVGIVPSNMLRILKTRK